MSATLSDKDFLLQRDWRERKIPKIGSDLWVPVYRSESSVRERSGIFCALIGSNRIAKSLRDPSWDLMVGDGLPGISVTYRGKEQTPHYQRFGSRDGIEPLLMYRSFHGLRSDFIELSEEFRHFHNLYYDTLNQEFIKLVENRNEEVVGRLSNDSADLRVQEIRQFLAVKKMHLAIFFDIVRFSPIDTETVSDGESHQEVRTKLCSYDFRVTPCDFSEPEHRSFSRLLGKKLIMPLPIEESAVWPFNKRSPKYEEFIVGTDAEGRAVFHTCDPDCLANYFGANPSAPHYLRPVYFRREVLAKYYANPQMYSVEDGYLRCGTLWGLRMDNNRSDCVVVFLGDLGRDLHHSEQLYWKSFNIAHEGGVSRTAFARSFKAEFSGPELDDLVFKSEYERLRERWRQQMGWDLFRDLALEDRHFFVALRIPLTKDQSEFDSQVLGLAKLLIDSVNESEIASRIGSGPPNEKGISKLERYLEQVQIPNHEWCIAFLRDLQSLRSSGVAHLKGDNYTKIAKRFGIGTKDLARVFESILHDAVTCLQRLSQGLRNE